MNKGKQETSVKCHKCKKVFPVAAVKDDDERQQAAERLRHGGGKIRVARWCPWCSEANMVELTVELVKDEIVFRDAGQTLAGLPAQ